MTRNADLSEETMRRLERRYLGEADRHIRDTADIPEMPGDSPAMHRSRVASINLRNQLEADAERWQHKNEGTAATHANASRTRQGPLARLYESGGLTLDQLAYSIEIASVAEAIERDVAPGIVNYEPRIDCSASGRNSVLEGIMRVRREVAYGHWRRWLPQPRRAVLDMIVGDPKPFSTVARLYGMGKAKTRRLLIEALDRWPSAMDIAEAEVDNSTIEAARAGLL